MLLVLDVEGTLFKTRVRLPGTHLDSTIWQSLAKELGSKAAAAEVLTHRKWENGEYANYLEWMRDTIGIHIRYGLTEKIFRRVLSSAEYNDGVQRVLSAVDRSFFEIVLVSGGFRELCARVQSDFSIFHAFAACEYLFDSRGAVTGYNLLPCDFFGKIDFVKLMLREYRLSDRDWIFVGDGENDVPIAKAAPVSIAYGSRHPLSEHSNISINTFEELLSVLESQRRGRNKVKSQITNL